MYICVECNRLFEEPKRYVETHGLDTPPYEEWYGCPFCSGSYTYAYRCHCCDDFITGDYIKTDDDLRYCENCYQKMDIGDED